MPAVPPRDTVIEGIKRVILSTSISRRQAGAAQAVNDALEIPRIPVRQNLPLVVQGTGGIES